MELSISPEIQNNLKRTVVVVIPCYNTGDRILSVLSKVCDLVNRVIVVDDGSTDGCTENVTQFHQVQTISFNKNRGKGYALIAGIAHALSLADVSAIALMDADGQHNPAELPQLYAEFIVKGVDLLVGERQLDKAKTPWRSRFGNTITRWITSKLFCCPLKDTQCGYRVLSPRFARDFIDNVPGGRYETEMLMILYALNQGYVLKSAAIATLYEPGNKSSHFRKVRDSYRIYRTLWQARKESSRMSKNTRR